MAKMIPDYINETAPGLDGERMVFDWFSSDAIKGVVLHSLLQKNQKRKLIAEVDFLYISNRGILCVEVKGGKAISRESGEWFSTSKAGRKNKINNPFNQVNDCCFALKNHLVDVYGKFSDEAQTLVGYAVVFPECIFTGNGNDLLTETMFDCSKNIDEFGLFLESVYDYWEQSIYKKLGKLPKHLSDRDMKKILDLLRGDFSVVPSLNLEMQHIERQMIALTEEQYDVLEAVGMNNKVIVMGGAGTGKTLLAIEQARRLLAENKKVVFLCFNRNLAKIIKESLNIDREMCHVDTYYNFIEKHMEKKLTHWPEANELADLFLAENSDVPQYDCLIVDEAQDLMFASVWESLDKFVIGGMEKGKWVLFLDPNQNMFNTTEDYDFAMEYLKDAYSPTIIPLSLNCRNTEQIGKMTTRITKMPSVKHMKISGPDVVLKPFSSEKELLKILKEEIFSLLKGGCLPKDMIVLSKYRLENSGLAGVESICNLNIHYMEDIYDFKVTNLNYSTIQSFKGLESNIVFLIDINGFETLKNRILNYVAATRAKIMLFVLYRDNAHDEYLKIK